ncbi:MAG: ArnT family glycosyltransferase [Bdellovibrionia bacterium]
MLPFFLILILLFQASTLGLSDDEAYYWVLSQKLSWSYAFHPPAVAAFIAGAQNLLGWFLGSHSEVVARLPAVLCSGAVLGLSLKWLGQVRAWGLFTPVETPCAMFPSQEEWDWKAQRIPASILLSFWGFFSLSWMMVPDLPLFLGWMLLFTEASQVCLREPKPWSGLTLALGAGLVLNSKYSGVLAVMSCGLSLVLLAKTSARRFLLGCLGLGSLLGVLPVLIWNASHEWASILYQIRDRHEGGGISWIRYLRFWGAELVFAGPGVIVSALLLSVRPVKSMCLGLLKHRALPRTVETYLFLWLFPALLVFGIQPLFSEFKAHWAFIAWWPGVLALALQSVRLNSRRPQWLFAGMAVQVVYGLLLFIFISVSLHTPWITRVAQFLVSPSSAVDPRWDVTHDFYGWNQLQEHLEQTLTAEQKKLPVIGSRYQTASQAWFYLPHHRVTFLPRSLKEMDEWPDLKVSQGQGPQWPRLTQEVLFVADHRYSQGPQFQNAKCETLTRLTAFRENLVAKWIDVWICRPL